jgi:hypothetical protein
MATADSGRRSVAADCISGKGASTLAGLYRERAGEFARLNFPTAASW